MKICIKCGRELPEEEFAKGRNTCKDCRKEYSQQHYVSNKQYYLDKAKRNKDKQQEDIKAYLGQYLTENPCVDCGERDIVVLDFDHRDPEQKSFNITDALRKGLGLKTIKAEIDKCDVRCANCHRRRTAVQFGWWRSNPVERTQHRMVVLA